MAIIENTNVSGARNTASRNGNIEINEATGEIIIRKNGEVKVRINSEGINFVMNSGATVTAGELGFKFTGANGITQVLIGEHPKDGHIVLAATEEGVDVIRALESE